MSSENSSYNSILTSGSKLLKKNLQQQTEGRAIFLNSPQQQANLHGLFIYAVLIAELNRSSLLLYKSLNNKELMNYALVKDNVDNRPYTYLYSPFLAKTRSLKSLSVMLDTLSLFTKGVEVSPSVYMIKVAVCWMCVCPCCSTNEDLFII